VLGVDPILTLVVIVPGFFLIGIVLEEGFLRFKIDELTSLIVTFGLTVILESLIQWIWTADFRRLESPCAGRSRLVRSSWVSAASSRSSRRRS
jgi:branched-chain amino acid transport system permease protein